MKKIMIGIALGFGANRLYKSKAVRNFLRRKTVPLVGSTAYKVVHVFVQEGVTLLVQNGMTERETIDLTEAMKTITAIVKRRGGSSKHLKAV
jgi:hypothetical protein